MRKLTLARSVFLAFAFVWSACLYCATADAGGVGSVVAVIQQMFAGNVQVSAPADQQVLVYQAASGKWTAAAVPGGGAATSLVAGGDSRVARQSAGIWRFDNNGATNYATLGSGGLEVQAAGGLAWSSTADATGATNTVLTRQSAGVLYVSNSVANTTKFAALGSGGFYVPSSSGYAFSNGADPASGIDLDLLRASAGRMRVTDNGATNYATIGIGGAEFQSSGVVSWTSGADATGAVDAGISRFSGGAVLAFGNGTQGNGSASLLAHQLQFPAGLAAINNILGATDQDLQIAVPAGQGRNINYFATSASTGGHKFLNDTGSTGGQLYGGSLVLTAGAFGAGGALAIGELGFTSDTRFARVSAAKLKVWDGTTNYLQLGTGGVNLQGLGVASWASGTDATAAADTGLSRTGVGTLSLGNGTQGSTTGTLNAANFVTPGATLANRFTSYNSVGVTAFGVPAILSWNRQAALTGASTVITTTSSGADGDYVISANILITAFTAGSVSMTCSYTSEDGTARVWTAAFESLAGTFTTTPNAAGAFEGVLARLRIKASTTVTIATTVAAFTGTYTVVAEIDQHE